jgi:hypothetical protein
MCIYVYMYNYVCMFDKIGMVDFLLLPGDVFLNVSVRMHFFNVVYACMHLCLTDSTFF